MVVVTHFFEYMYVVSAQRKLAVCFFCFCFFVHLGWGRSFASRRPSAAVESSSRFKRTEENSAKGDKQEESLPHDESQDVVMNFGSSGSEDGTPIESFASPTRHRSSAGDSSTTFSKNIPTRVGISGASSARPQQIATRNVSSKSAVSHQDDGLRSPSVREATRALRPVSGSRTAVVPADSTHGSSDDDEGGEDKETSWSVLHTLLDAYEAIAELETEHRKVQSGKHHVGEQRGVGGPTSTTTPMYNALYRVVWEKTFLPGQLHGILHAVFLNLSSGSNSSGSFKDHVVGLGSVSASFAQPRPYHAFWTTTTTVRAPAGLYAQSQDGAIAAAYSRWPELNGDQHQLQTDLDRIAGAVVGAFEGSVDESWVTPLGFVMDIVVKCLEKTLPAAVCWLCRKLMGRQFGQRSASSLARQPAPSKTSEFEAMQAHGNAAFNFVAKQVIRFVLFICAWS